MRTKLPEAGETRVISKFLWFSRWIEHERRWLERASIRQVYVGPGLMDVRGSWMDIAWEDSTCCPQAGDLGTGKDRA